MKVLIAAMLAVVLSGAPRSIALLPGAIANAASEWVKPQQHSQ